MNNTIRRLSGAWASSPGHSSPEAPPSKHRHHRCRQEKNYDTLPLGGNRPIASATTAVNHTTALSEQEATRLREERRQRRHWEKLRERELSENARSSTLSLGAESKSSRSSKSSRRKHQDEMAVTGSSSDKRREYASDDKTSSAVVAGVPIAPAMESQQSVSSLDSNSFSSSATSGVAISQRRKQDDTGASREPSTPFITTTPPTPSPLEQARRRNTRPVSLISPSNTVPPYPITPPISDRKMESSSGDYVAFHQHLTQTQPSSLSGLGIRNIHSSLRPGSPGARPRANTTPSTASARPTLPRHVSTTAAAVEIGSSDSIVQRKSSQKEDPYLMLKRFDTVLLVDDSASMVAHWDATRDALETVATVALKHDDDGVDIHFMNHPESDAWNVKSAVHIRRLFAQVEPSGITPTGQCLDEILREYIGRYSASRGLPASPDSSPSFPLFPNGVKPNPPKPLNILVLTDGEPTDDPESVIVWVARKLEQLNAPLHQVGIQFLQIGDEEGAREALEELDDALEGIYGIRDMVDTTRYVQEGEEISGSVLLKALMGGINRRLDRRRL